MSLSKTKSKISTKKEASCISNKCLISRRGFLLGSGAVAVSTMAVTLLPGTAKAAKAEVQVARYPSKKIGNIKQLKQDIPVAFNYPDEGRYSDMMLVRTGTRCGGGVGPKQDVVAFSTFCTHQGGPLDGSYNKKYKSLGQCPFHLSTYDLTRYGMLISGQAYESLPQVVLEMDKKGDIYAVGMMGLIFGRYDNLEA
mgnify:CR=1 FL=1